MTSRLYRFLYLQACKNRAGLFYSVVAAVLYLGFWGVVLVASGVSRESKDSHTSLFVRGAQLHDFGKCRQDDVLTHEFVLVNSGPAPLKVTDIISSCGCVVSLKDKHSVAEAIAPGATVAIPVRFKVGGVQSTATARIDVRYQSVADKKEVLKQSETDQLSLLVSADVIPDYRITPRELNLGEIDGLVKDRANGTIRVTSEAIDADIQGIHTSCEELRAKIISTANHGKEFEIAVELDASKFVQNRSFVGSLTLDTNSERLPRALIPIIAKFNSPIAIEPESVEIGSNERGEVRRKIIVTTSKPAQIRNAQCESSALRVECDNSRISQKHTVWLEIKPCQSAPLDTKLTLELEIFSHQEKNGVRRATVPVYRFLSTKEIEDGKS